MEDGLERDNTGKLISRGKVHFIRIFLTVKISLSSRKELLCSSVL